MKKETCSKVFFSGCLVENFSHFFSDLVLRCLNKTSKYENLNGFKIKPSADSLFTH